MFTWILITGIVLSIIYIVKVRRDYDSGKNIPENFTGKEKLAIWILSFISPIIFGTIFYYTLRSRLPKKAKYANNVSWITVLLYLLSWYILLRIVTHGG